MLNKVLIANRGAIAVRIIRTLREMGVLSVAIYAEVDANSPHVVQADEAYSLGDGAASDTYLNQDKIITIVHQCGAQAVHPGYGFLSENADFCERLEQQGIAFIGPTPEQMRAFGLKHEARLLARDNGLPLLPGSQLLTSPEEAVAFAADIGFPVMLKSTAGGGGIGMQVCQSAEQLYQCWESIKRLSANNFSNSGVFVEKYVANARHIEVQIFGDGQGRAVILGDRDCSTQRRNQKVIEEAPAPHIPGPVRSQLHQVARTLVESVQYRGAGTVEFIYDQSDDAFYFLEMNTRLQVEHGVTEQIFAVDLVQWMVQLVEGTLPPLAQLEARLAQVGHAIQARIYAENPAKDFQPCAGILNVVQWPDTDGKALRIDHWIESGTEVSAFFDPMLAKVIAYAPTRAQAIEQLSQALASSVIEGIENNRDYVHSILQTEALRNGQITTRFLSQFHYRPATCDVLSSGTLTTVQDYPGRLGYWHVGVPPSGPFDAVAFRLGNRLLENDAGAAGLEFTFNGPTLKFNCATQIVLTGAQMDARLDGLELPMYAVIQVSAGQILKLGKIFDAGARTYLLIAEGFQCHRYLGSRSTFTLGQFGGVTGRALQTGDVLHLSGKTPRPTNLITLPELLRPKLSKNWQLRVIYGPHGAPDFFTEADIKTFFSSSWRVHYNSSRTGVRLIGPKPNWARTDGGEAGMHPSNIHDNAYAIGSIDFTGDMPVILGPDGPSLGGFVCPATVIGADLWKLGQLCAGDVIQFIPITIADAVALAAEQNQTIEQLRPWSDQVESAAIASPIIKLVSAEKNGVQVVYRPSGEQNILVEYGPLQLDIELRFRVHALMLHLQNTMTQDPSLAAAVIDLTPGIRSLQIHYDAQRMSLDCLMAYLEYAESQLRNVHELKVPSRIVHLPLSWDDKACHLAVEKYMQSVRKDAPWCPSNIEFIRRINGLSSIDEVKATLFNASYVVMGLGDVYLGAPVATPLDPRHRLVTTKYNPARTWTAENSVGIGGSYMCIYGMEGPGGYQFVGRTLQMWNRYRQTAEFTQPWLLRFFDQIRFYEVSAEELEQIRRDFPRGHYPLKIEETEFCLRDYQAFLSANQTDIDHFVTHRNAAFEAELQRWVASGQIHFNSEVDADETAVDNSVDEGFYPIESPVAGNIWQVLVQPGDRVEIGDVVCILESMKMEIDIVAPLAGTVAKILRHQGQATKVGQTVLLLSEE